MLGLCVFQSFTILLNYFSPFYFKNKGSRTALPFRACRARPCRTPLVGLLWNSVLFQGFEQVSVGAKLV